MTDRHVAFYVSSHGFGHGARVSAVAAALRARRPDTHLHLVSDLPAWFFRRSLKGPLDLREESVDVGVVQRTAFQEDLASTLDRLAAFYPLDEERIASEAAWARRAGIDLIVADIAPLGIAVAKRVGIPSVLIENFTWAFVYRAYAAGDPRFAQYAEYVQRWIDEADLHLRTKPVAGPGTGDRTVGPIARRPRRSRRDVCAALGVPPKVPMVLVSMGGTPWSAPSLVPMHASPGTTFIVSADVSGERREENIVLLPPDSEVLVSDLVGVCDAVIGKAGYSTIAEVYHAGVPFGFVSRPDFPEAPHLQTFVLHELGGIRVEEAALVDGSWVARVDELLTLPLTTRNEPNGAEEVSEVLAGWLGA